MEFNKPGKLDRFINVHENDRVFAARREEIFAALQPWVAKKLAEDPKFNISAKNLKEFIKEHPNVFPTQRSTNAVTKYFGDSIDYLKEKLGLPVKIQKE